MDRLKLLQTPVLVQLTKNDDGTRQNPQVEGFVQNYNCRSVVKCLPECSEAVIQDVYAVIKHHEDLKQPMPPTTCFKANATVVFTLMAEIFAMILPRHIKISLPKAFQTY